VASLTPIETSPVPAEDPVERLELSFTGPFGWFGSVGAPPLAEAVVAHRPGIYVWTYPTLQGELAYYVGETARSFVRRMNEHLSEQLSGRYRLYEPDAFARAEKKLLWRGVYGAGAETSVEPFVDRLETLATPLVKFVRTMRFHLAMTDISDRLRRRVEAGLAQHFYRQPGPVGSFQEADIHYDPRTDEERRVQVHIRWVARPTGAPEVLLA
jgi:hypothetical protein